MSEAEKCYHCSNPVPAAINLHVTVGGEDYAVCCRGCQAVANLIHNDGLQQFYRFRDKRLEAPEPISSLDRSKYALYDRDDVLSSIATHPGSDGKRTLSLSLEGITCAACVWLVEQFVRKLPGVDEFWVNLSNHRATLTWNQNATPLSDVLLQLQSIGFRGYPFSATEEEKRLADEQKSMLVRLGIAGIGMMQNMMLAVPMYFGLLQDTPEYVDLFRFISLIVAMPVILYSARPFFNAALRDIRLRHLTMDVPVSLAIGGAFAASVWITFRGGPEVYFDSVCMFTFFLLLGRYLESRARMSAAQSNARLKQKAPQFVDLLPSQGEQNSQIDLTKAQLTPLRDIRVGDLILFKAGDLIPVDGEIVQGESSVNEAALTGEFMPRPRCAGDAVLSGSVNIDNALVVRVTALDQDSHLSTINRLVERALQERPQLSAMADRVASYFVAGVLLTAAIVGVIWWRIDPAHAFAITLSVLVVTCPCALSLATPTALTTATTALRQSGLIITRGHALETLARASRVVFDKTGTLTQGELSLVKTDNRSRYSDAELLALAGSLEWDNPHPIAKVFQDYAQGPAEQIRNHTGQGVEGMRGATVYRLGNLKFATEKLPESQMVTPENYQTVALADDQQLLALFYLTDSLRPSAKEALRQLQQEQGLRTAILSGDSSAAVETIASELAVTDIEKSCSPEGKLERVKQWQKEGDTVVMVGDGVNDVPVMAGAHLAVAMNNATDLTQVRADAVILNGDLRTFAFGVKKARDAYRIIRQNLSWAVCYNLLALPLAAAGYVPPYAAAIGMSVSSLIVVLNALRLSGVQKP
ncbi:heavy metal translocating P-type ATPase [Hahella sp. CR1]|uniref:heavy metal translocating P-type ATPase n=1 Tax=Hahella sp. CR1 TaxID=2992807 RepID=UPI00244158C1|nr:heavy metal translocating P-type ATPase [Hahella sp. CR1]MDG9667423.1 heavy metal translocating P-type ATPase [Hahella sp. CR1]